MGYRDHSLLGEETWAIVPGFGDYEVSDWGRVRCLRRAGALVSPFTSHGYLRVSLWRDGRQHKRQVHSLVALAHIDPFPDPGLEVSHVDGDRQNNHVSNLEWIDHRTNCGHKRSHGTAPGPETHPATKISRDVGRAILEAVEAGTSLREAARVYGVCLRTIQRVVAREMRERDIEIFDLPY